MIFYDNYNILSCIIELHLSFENSEPLQNQVATCNLIKSRRILDFVFIKTYFDVSVKTCWLKQIKIENLEL